MRRHLLPRWGKLKANAITRADVRAMMVRIDAPISPIRRSPPRRRSSHGRSARRSSPSIRATAVDRNPTRDRERVLSDAEIKLLWTKLDPALKLILLTGQRPGEVAAMQREHIVDGWWQMPGKPQGDWPGTKNGTDHRVALSEPALALVELHLASEAAPEVEQAVEEAGHRARHRAGNAARSAANLPD